MRPDELRIPSPCDADWNAMEPRAGARFCASCELEVVDVSTRTETEMREILRSARGTRVCVSYEKNRDGTIRTAKDPSVPDVPLRSLTRRGARVLAAASIALAACSAPEAPPEFLGRTAGAPVVEVQPPPPPPPPTERLGGAIAPEDVPPPPVESADPEPVAPHDDRPHRVGRVRPEPRMMGDVAF